MYIFIHMYFLSSGRKNSTLRNGEASDSFRFSFLSFFFPLLLRFSFLGVFFYWIEIWFPISQRIFFFILSIKHKKKFNLKFLFVLFLLFSVAFRPEELAHSTRRAEMADRGEAHARGRRPSLPRIRIQSSILLRFPKTLYKSCKESRNHLGIFQRILKGTLYSHMKWRT